MTPPGRFLARKDEAKKGPGSIKAPDNVWYEVADKKAREKASQCLRERTPDVLPYIKQLREQQDAITEKGVSMVQHQLQMQQQRQEHYPAQMVGSMVGINDHGEMVLMQQQLPPQQYSMDGMATLRRTSLPEPQQQPLAMTSSNGYVQQCSMSIGLGPPLQQHRSMSLGHGVPSPNGAVYLRGNANIQQMPPGRYHVVQNGEVTPQTVVSQEYHHPQMMMQPGQTHFVIQSTQPPPPPPPQQQQHQHQVLSMHQMQFQQPQMMARIAQPMSQPMQQPPPPPPQMMIPSSHIPMPNQPMGQMIRMSGQQQHAVTANSLFEDDNEPEPYSVQSDPLFSMRIATPSRKKGSEKTAETEVKPTKEQRRKGSTKSPLPPSATTKTALKPPGDRRAPDRTATAASLMSIGTALDAGGEITIEEYRKQLQQYLEHNQVNHDGDDNDDDHDNNSDLEDDWEKEREKNLREDKTRGVGRNVSGMSFISSRTAKSGQSMVSGISSGIFSTDLSADMSEDKNKGSLNNSNRSLCSNLSLMSELTDLSENIDTLTLDD
jgi:hypothetical protein